jgi:hypothetical protein
MNPKTLTKETVSGYQDILPKPTIWTGHMNGQKDLDNALCLHSWQTPTIKIPYGNSGLWQPQSTHVKQHTNMLPKHKLPAIILQVELKPRNSRF